jgi:hypothetical protein
MLAKFIKNATYVHTYVPDDINFTQKNNYNFDQFWQLRYVHFFVSTVHRSFFLQVRNIAFWASTFTKKAFISLFIFPARSSPFRKSNYEFAFKPVPPGPYVQGLFNACETVHLISSSGHFCYVPIRKLPPKVHVSWRQCLDHTRARFCFHSFTRWRSYVIWLLRHYLFSQKWDTIRRIIVTKLRRLIDEIQ